MDEGRERRLCQTRVLEEHRSLLVRQLTDLRLQSRGQRDDLGMLGGCFVAEGLQLGGLLADLVLTDVGDVQYGLGGEEGKALEEFGLLGIEAQGANRFAFIEVSRQSVEQFELLLLLGPWLEAGSAGDLLPPFVDHVEVRQRQLEIDHSHVAPWVELAVNVLDIRIGECPDDHRQRVELANVREKLVAHSLAATGARHQPRDIDEFHHGRRDFLRFVHLGQHVEPLVRDLHHRGVRLDGAEGIGGHPRTGAGQRIEQRGFSDVGKADDTDAQCHRKRRS